MTPRKRGRKKKRGPKKKLPPKQYKGRNTWNYKIVSCRNMRQNGYIGKFANIKDAYKCMDELMKESESVVFPKKVVNERHKTDCVDEYLILERKKEDKDVLLRNEYGKLVEHKTNTEKWLIFDKFRYQTEETFWVYGYDPVYGRKTFMWIYDNIITNNTGRYNLRRIFVYNNKVIIKNDQAEMDIVFCKNKSEAIRFYNFVGDLIKKDGVKNVYFVGAYGGQGVRTKSIVDEICAYTGWDRKKVLRGSLI